MELYVVKKGDNVDAIAAAAGIPVETLIWNNELAYPYRLAVGQALYLGGRLARERPALSAFGYAYPFISPEVLEETLPYLTELLIFSYGFTAGGELVEPWHGDEAAVDRARGAGVQPLLTLTPLGSDGHFNNGLISSLVHDAAAQQRLIRSLWRTLEEKGYGGVDIDFEYVLGEDREAYAAFVGRLRRVLSAFGYRVSAAVAPKTHAGQPGLLYDGIDYRLLGQAADRILLMTYEWGYSQGPPMAVAPLPMVRRVAEYGLTEIPGEKLCLGIPNYGYDWPLPYERGRTRARTLGLHEAVQLAIEHGAQIEFDETARSPWFRYWQYGVQHEVWFEDVRSLRAKFELIRELGLAGAGFWQLMKFFRPGWLLMEDCFTILRERVK